MKVIDIYPEYASFSDEELVKNIPGNVIVCISTDIAEYYDSKLDMSAVYGIYGHSFNLTTDSQQQLPCLLPSHGTQDRHPSARFYPEDRNTGEVRHAVYCHKCQKLTTPFWLLYRKESFLHGMQMREFYIFLQKTFHIPFPRHIYLNFDPVEYYTFTESEARAKVHKINYANTLLLMKETGEPLYLGELKRFWQEV